MPESKSTSHLANPSLLVVAAVELVSPHHRPDGASGFFCRGLNRSNAVAGMLAKNAGQGFALLAALAAPGAIVLLPLHADLATTHPQDGAVSEDGNQVPVESPQESKVVRPARADQARGGFLAIGFAFVAIPNDLIDLGTSSAK